MKVECIKLGYLQENCYLLEKNGDYLLVDPGEEFDKIISFIKDKNVIGILITHRHFDHVDSLDKLIDMYHYPVYEHSNLKEGLKKIGRFNIEIIYTPGHTKDSVSYYFVDDKIIVTGDFLFKRTIGRCDLEGGDEREMRHSIEKIQKYDDDIIIYPGHGDKSILGDEKKYNPYF